MGAGNGGHLSLLTHALLPQRLRRGVLEDVLAHFTLEVTAARTPDVPNRLTGSESGDSRRVTDAIIYELGYKGVDKRLERGTNLRQRFWTIVEVTVCWGLSEQCRVLRVQKIRSNYLSTAHTFLFLIILAGIGASVRLRVL